MTQHAAPRENPAPREQRSDQNPIRLDRNPNDVMIDGKWVNEFRQAARKGVKEQQLVVTKFNRHLAENMIGEQRHPFMKFIDNKWTKRAGLLAAGALAAVAAPIAVNGAPDWMGDAWNAVAPSAEATGGAVSDTLNAGVEAFSELPGAVQGGLIAGTAIAGPAAVYLAGRRLRKGPEEQRYARDAEIRRYDERARGIETGQVRYEKKTT
jgi:hypothetical protein